MVLLFFFLLGLYLALILISGAIEYNCYVLKMMYLPIIIYCVLNSYLLLINYYIKIKDDFSLKILSRRL